MEVVLEDLGQPEVRKKFCRCILLMDRVSELLQSNNPIMTFSSYLNRLPDLQNTISIITQTIIFEMLHGHNRVGDGIIGQDIKTPLSL